MERWCATREWRPTTRGRKTHSPPNLPPFYTPVHHLLPPVGNESSIKRLYQCVTSSVFSLPLAFYPTFLLSLSFTLIHSPPLFAYLYLYPIFLFLFYFFFSHFCFCLLVAFFRLPLAAAKSRRVTKNETSEISLTREQARESVQACIFFFATIKTSR